MQSPISLKYFEASVEKTQTAVSPPPAVFTSPDFYNFELAAVWGHEWFCIGRATDIPNKGDFFSVTVGNDPLMVVRGSDGEVHVQTRVCQHRGMILVEGAGNVRRFTCPYHSWVYGLDGQLLSAPDLNDKPWFEKAKICLPRVRSEVWEGFVFVTFDDSLPPVAERLGNLSEHLTDWNLSSLRSASPQKFVEYAHNWKLFGDECYHCRFLHAKTYHQMHPVPGESIDFNALWNDPENGVIGYDVVGDKIGGSPTRTGMNLQPLLPGLSEEQLKKVVFATVAPNLLIIAMCDKVKYFLWMPTAADGSLFAATWLYPESTLAKPGFIEEWQQEVADLGGVMREDEMAWAGTQRGMKSRFAPRGRYAPAEEVLVRLNRWLYGKYRQEEERSPS